MEGPGCLWGGTRGWGSEEEAGQTLFRAWQLLRRLCCEQTESLELVVSENHLLAQRTLFQVSQASQARKPPNVCLREAEQDCCQVLLDSFLKVHAHR